MKNYKKGSQKKENRKTHHRISFFNLCRIITTNLQKNSLAAIPRHSSPTLQSSSSSILHNCASFTIFLKAPTIGNHQSLLENLLSSSNLQSSSLMFFWKSPQHHNSRQMQSSESEKG
ncbi:hypothetical protein RYX36_014100 [Vicia faba]